MLTSSQFKTAQCMHDSPIEKIMGSMWYTVYLTLTCTYMYLPHPDLYLYQTTLSHMQPASY